MNDEQPTQPCICDIYDMWPDRIAFPHENKTYTHVCGKCGGGITYGKNDDYNRFHEFSGYDDYREDRVKNEDGES